MLPINVSNSKKFFSKQIQVILKRTYSLMHRFSTYAEAFKFTKHFSYLSFKLFLASYFNENQYLLEIQSSKVKKGN